MFVVLLVIGAWTIPGVLTGAFTSDPEAEQAWIQKCNEASRLREEDPEYITPVDCDPPSNPGMY